MKPKKGHKTNFFDLFKLNFFVHLKIFLKGLLMGSADIVPGVSGGTMALITGIYTRLIDAITYVFGLFRRDTLYAFAKLDLKKIKKLLGSIDLALFIPLISGILVAFFSLSNVVHFMMDEHMIKTYSFFFGLIIASALLVYRKIERMNLNSFLLLVIGFLIAFILAGLQGLKASHSLPIIFGSGAIAITAMILPGISGAFILVLLNQYEYIIRAIKELDIIIIIVFGVGAFFGLLAFSELLKHLLHNYKDLTMGFLLGLMVGSLRLQYGIISSASIDMYVIQNIVVAGLIGFFIVIFLDKLGQRNAES